MSHRNALNWFEIPVRDLDRAQAFYETLLATPKVQLPGEVGCFAHITDTEGNRIGLHAPR